jgi:hypothetical protein
LLIPLHLDPFVPLGTAKTTGFRVEHGIPRLFRADSNHFRAAGRIAVYPFIRSTALRELLT